MSAKVSATKAFMVDDVGGAPDGECPWRAMTDPLVVDVVSVRAMASEDHGAYQAYVGGNSVPRRLVEGLRVFEPAFSSAREAERKRVRAADEPAVT